MPISLSRAQAMNALARPMATAKQEIKTLRLVIVKSPSSASLGPLAFRICCSRCLAREYMFLQMLFRHRPAKQAAQDLDQLRSGLAQFVPVSSSQVFQDRLPLRGEPDSH